MEKFTQARYNMVEGQIRINNISDSVILAIMLTLEREKFVHPSLATLAYSDAELPLISPIEASNQLQYRKMPSPLTQARILKAAAIEPTDSVLVIGSGYGYLSAALSQYAGFVLAIEEDAGLVDQLSQIAADLAIDNLMVQEASFAKIAKDRQIMKQGPFQKIIFEGAIGNIPAEFISLIASEGKIIYITENERGVPALMVRHYYEKKFIDREVCETNASPIPSFSKESVFAFV